MKKFKKKIVFEIDYFLIKSFNSQLIINDLMTNKTIFAATSYSRSVQ
jgi:hypothetical protein